MPAPPKRSRTSPEASPARRIAHRVLVRVARDQAYAELALASQLDRLEPSPRERALATELVYGTLRHLTYLDFLIAELVRKRSSKLPIEVRTALRVGAHQLLHLRVPDHSAVNEAVLLVRARQPRLTGLVNATLRALAQHRDAGTLPDPGVRFSDPLEALAVAGSVPPYLVRRVADELGHDEAAAWVQASGAPPSLSLRVNRLKTERATLAATLRAAGLTVVEPEAFVDGLWVERSGSVTGLPGFADGLFTVQDLAATLVGYLAQPRPGMVVLDACAAPGGKATHLAELMGDRGTVVAVDVHPGRAQLVDEAAARLGLSSVRVTVADATDGAALAAILSDHGVQAVDLALIDAPCSGLGTLRRNPELRALPQQRIDALRVLQGQILDAVAPLVRPGGALVYAVCTPTHEEGRDQVARFLERARGFNLELPCQTGPQGALLAPFVTADGTVRTWTHRHGVDSFFAARFGRSAD